MLVTGQGQAAARFTPLLTNPDVVAGLRRAAGPPR